MDKISFKLGDKVVSAVLYNYDGEHPEIVLQIEENNGLIHQDICCVRAHVNTQSKDISDTSLDCLVWSDENDDDYTHKFNIGVYQDENLD